MRMPYDLSSACAFNKHNYIGISLYWWIFSYFYFFQFPKSQGYLPTVHFKPICKLLCVSNWRPSVARLAALQWSLQSFSWMEVEVEMEVEVQMVGTTEIAIFTRRSAISFSWMLY